MNRKAVVAVLFVAISTMTAVAKNGDWKDATIKVGDIRVHYIEAGSGDRTLVFIPGWTMTAEVWREQIPYFAARGFRVIAYDPRGHGLTGKTDSGNLYRQHAADFHAFLKQLKIEHSYMVAWGSGATMLFEYFSSTEKLKPEKIVFVEGGPAALKADEYPGMTTMQDARKLLIGMEEDRKKATEQYVRTLFKGKPAEWLVSEMTRNSLKVQISAAYSLYFDLFTGDRTPALMRIPVPSLIMTTTDNRAVGEYMKSRIPRSELEVLEGAGSAMFLEKPQTFNQMLERFLGEH